MTNLTILWFVNRVNTHNGSAAELDMHRHFSLTKSSENSSFDPSQTRILRSDPTHCYVWPLRIYLSSSHQ